jgi:hypothetical protein
MAALTFKQALVKYRPDQARDQRGRFADEAGSSSDNDHAAEWRAQLKPRMGVPGRKRILESLRHSILMARQGDIAGRAVGGSVPAFREAQIADMQRFARELEASIAALQAKQKPKGAQPSIRSIARQFGQWITASGGDDAHLRQGEHLHNVIRGARLSQKDWHNLALDIDMQRLPKSMSGAKVRAKILARIRDKLVFGYKRQSRAGRSAA